jgi:plasmid maintenance system antidote protein VapI
MSTNVQQVIEKQRAVYDTLAKPLLQQLSELHGLTIRDIAAIFKISKGHAEAVLKHRVFPSLELAVRIARYFETNVDCSRGAWTTLATEGHYWSSCRGWMRRSGSPSTTSGILSLWFVR